MISWARGQLSNAEMMNFRDQEGRNLNFVAALNKTDSASVNVHEYHKQRAGLSRASQMFDSFEFSSLVYTVHTDKLREKI
jgi:hypothetical protein